MKVMFDTNGRITAYRDGQLINGDNLLPTPKTSDWEIIKNAYETKGAVIYSSMWVGWTCTCNKPCGGNQNGNLDGSSYSIKNLKITGSIVQGPMATKCS
jgi:hypothetical protein